MPMTDKTVQVVIEIPEEVYKSIRDNEYCGIIDSDMYNAIANGTQLPKGHGALKDATTLMKMFEDKVGDVFTAFHFFEAIGDCPTIIEADKEVDG